MTLLTAGKRRHKAKVANYLTCITINHNHPNALIQIVQVDANKIKTLKNLKIDPQNNKIWKRRLLLRVP